MVNIHSLKKLSLLLAGSCAALAGMPTVSHADTTELVLACYASDTQKGFEAHIIPAFERAFNAHVTYVPGVSTSTIAKLAAQKNSPEVDVACLDDGPRQQAQDMGLIQKTDPAKLPNLAKVSNLARMPDNYGIGWALFGVGLVYNPKAFSDAGIPAPTSWNDLRNPALKDHVIPSDITTTYGVAMLVKLAEANGGGVSNIDPGFKAMKQVAANSIAFDSTADVTSFFQQGEAWLGVWTEGQAAGYVKSTGVPMKFVYPKEGATALLTTASVVKGAKHQVLAEAFLNYLLSPEAQDSIGKDIGFGPVGDVKMPDNNAGVVYGAQATEKLKALDWKKIIPVRSQWTDRWNREVVR